MRRLLLVRHATSVPPTVEGPCDSDRPLTDIGMEQAAALVDVLVPQSPGRVVSSPFLRALLTVSPAAAALGVPVEVRDDLAEWSSRIGPAPAWKELYRMCWEDVDRSVNGGETHRALEGRAVTALRAVAAQTPEGAVTVVGSHGTWIARALHGLGCRVDADFWLEMPMPAVFAVEIGEAGQRVSGPGIVPA